MEVMTLAEAVSQGEKNRGTNSAVVILVDLPQLADESKELQALAAFCQSANAVVPLWNPSTPVVPTSFKNIEHYGDYYPNSIFDNCLAVWDRVSKTRRLKHRSVKDIALDLWLRKSTGDVLFLLLVLIDSFSNVAIKTVQSVTSSDNTSFDQFYCMATKCTDEIAACLLNENCRKALDCLENCKGSPFFYSITPPCLPLSLPPLTPSKISFLLILSLDYIPFQHMPTHLGNDQVCSYRCIVSYESEEFENFAKCILQRNNCMKNTAVAPVYPDPQVIATPPLFLYINPLHYPLFNLLYCHSHSGDYHPLFDSSILTLCINPRYLPPILNLYINPLADSSLYLLSILTLFIGPPTQGTTTPLALSHIPT